MNVIGALFRRELQSYFDTSCLRVYRHFPGVDGCIYVLSRKFLRTRSG